MCKQSTPLRQRPDVCPRSRGHVAVHASISKQPRPKGVWRCGCWRTIFSSSQELQISAGKGNLRLSSGVHCSVGFYCSGGTQTLSIPISISPITNEGFRRDTNEKPYGVFGGGNSFASKEMDYHRHLKCETSKRCKRSIVNHAPEGVMFRDVIA